MTSYPIQNVSFTFAPLGVVLKMYEDIKWHKFKAIFRLICRYYILMSYVDFTDETRWLVGWLVGCFGFNGPLRQYFSLYRAVSQREGERGEKG